MNREDPYRDQAERLRKRISKKQDLEAKAEKTLLPPRSRVHREKRNKNKWKLKYPVIRLLALFFILLPVTIVIIYNYLENQNIGGSEKASTNNAGYETVGYAKQSSEKGTIVEILDEKEDKAAEETETVTKEYKVKEPSDAKIPSNEEIGNKDSEKMDEQKTESNVNTDKQPDQIKQEQGNKQEETKKEGSIIYHTVQPSETIFRIAMKYYQSQSGIETIKKANNLGSNEIQVGQVLKIPLN